MKKPLKILKKCVSILKYIYKTIALFLKPLFLGFLFTLSFLWLWELMLELQLNWDYYKDFFDPLSMLIYLFGFSLFLWRFHWLLTQIRAAWNTCAITDKIAVIFFFFYLAWMTPLLETVLEIIDLWFNLELVGVKKSYDNYMRWLGVAYLTLPPIWWYLRGVFQKRKK